MQRGAQLGFPAEIYDTNALFWAHVMAKRQEYETLLTGPNRNTPAYEPFLASFWREAYVDPKYITESLSEADIAAANTWKIAYLRRLAAEKVDVSYINAYLQAWNLSSNQVLGTR